MEAQALTIGDIRPLHQALTRLSLETAWPETAQGAAARLFAFDVEQFCGGAIQLLETGHISVALSLVRVIQERGEHLVASALDARFARRYIEFEPEKANARGKKSKPRTGDSNNVIASLAKQMGDPPSDILALMATERSFGSLLVHPSLGLPAIALGLRDEPERYEPMQMRLYRVVADCFALVLTHALLASSRLAGVSDAVKFASATLNNWLVTFGGLSMSDLTGGDDSRIEYI